MKDTFTNLNAEKKNRIIQASLAEFARNGYEHTALDDIVKAAGISKGGLYEYISAKEDLFRFLLDYSYTAMFDWIMSRTGINGLPGDPVERTRSIALVAVDFYIAHPEIISFLVKASASGQENIREMVRGTFDSYFARLYETSDYSRISCESSRVLALLEWLLVKTRNDFMETGSRERYLEEWDFFLSVLTHGIYGSP